MSVLFEELISNFNKDKKLLINELINDIDKPIEHRIDGFNTIQFINVFEALAHIYEKYNNAYEEDYGIKYEVILKKLEEIYDINNIKKNSSDEIYTCIINKVRQSLHNYD